MSFEKMMQTDLLIGIEDLYFTYGSEEEIKEEKISPALKNINLSINTNEIIVLIGASGCGKTTLCRCICGIIPRVIKGRISGSIKAFDKEITNKDEISLAKIAEKMGIVMQEPDNQIVMTTIEDELAFGPENLMREPVEIRRKVDKTIERINLMGRELDNPSKLSGGEKQRLVVGGILIMDSQILIFDEPMSNLDRIEKNRFIKYLKELKVQGKTIIIVEHDYENLDFADRWVLMKNGKILDIGSPLKIDKEMLELELWQ